MLSPRTAKCAISIVLAVVATGCTNGNASEPPMGSVPDCGFELKRDLDDERRPVSIPKDILTEHAEFRRMIERPDRPEGIGMPIMCDEGQDIMRALEAAGASIRRFDPPSQDTLVRLDDGTYLLLLAVTHADRST